MLPNFFHGRLFGNLTCQISSSNHGKPRKLVAPTSPRRFFANPPLQDRGKCCPIFSKKTFRQCDIYKNSGSGIKQEMLPNSSKEILQQLDFPTFVFKRGKMLSNFSTKIFCHLAFQIWCTKTRESCPKFSKNIFRKFDFNFVDKREKVLPVLFWAWLSFGCARRFFLFGLR